MNRFFSLLLFLFPLFCYGQDPAHLEWVDAVAQGMSHDFRETPVFRLPKMIVCNNGVIVLGCEAKVDVGSRASFHAIAISNDGGKSFIAKKSDVRLHEIVYDRINDRILSYAGTTFFASDDQGRTWYDYRSRINTRLPKGFDEISMSPTAGIQLKNGILAIPMRCIKYNRDSKGNKMESIEREVVFVLYSKDYGKNWDQSPWTDESIIADEVIIVEYANNQIMLNARGGTEFSWEKTNNGRRVFVPEIKSKASIINWRITGWKTEHVSDGVIYDPICNASIVSAKIGWRKVALFCNPDMPGEYWPRKNLCLRASRDFKTWKKIAQITPTDYPVLGYSSLAYFNGNIYFAYEDEKKGIQFCSLNILKERIIEITKR